MFITDDNKTQVKPLSAEAMEKIYINGIQMTSMDPVTLKPNDRVIFGTQSCFLFRNQLRDSESGPIKDDPANPITYEMAMQEKLQNEEAEQLARKEEEKKKAEEEAAAKMAEIKAQMDAEKAAQEAEQERMRKEFEDKMAAMQAEIAAKKNDEEAKAAAEEAERKMRIEMEYKIEQDKIRLA